MFLWTKTRRAFLKQAATMAVLPSAILSGAILSGVRSSTAQTPPVDLLLLLAIDCSYSVDADEFALQKQGMSFAFLDHEIIDAVLSGPFKRIAVSVMQWSSETSQILSVPWTLLDSPQAVFQFSSVLTSMPRQTADGATALGDAMARAGAYIQSAPFTSFRKVIDVSGDGRRNTGSDVDTIRSALLSRGITINGLAIRNEDSDLDLYYKTNVIGGMGSFMIVANDYDGYQRAIKKKLLREISFNPISKLSEIDN